MIEGLYPHAIDCGISPSLFWSMAIDEINDVIESYQRNYVRTYKDKLAINQLLAKHIVDNFVPILVEKIPSDYKFTNFWELFPDWFEKEKEKYEEEKEREEFEKFKEKRRQYAAMLNKKMNRGDDS